MWLMSLFHFLLKAVPKIDYLGIILDLKWPFLLCFTFIIFSLPWHPFQFHQAGEKCLMFIQRPKTLGENHPPLPPWLTTARQRGANRPAAAAGGEIRPPSRPWRLDERARPLPPRPCANQLQNLCKKAGAVVGTTWASVPVSGKTKKGPCGTVLLPKKAPPPAAPGAMPPRKDSKRCAWH